MIHLLCSCCVLWWFGALFRLYSSQFLFHTVIVGYQHTHFFWICKQQPGVCWLLGCLILPVAPPTINTAHGFSSQFVFSSMVSSIMNKQWPSGRRTSFTHHFCFSSVWAGCFQLLGVMQNTWQSTCVKVIYFFSFCFPSSLDKPWIS